jgi:hypothetical protein
MIISEQKSFEELVEKIGNNSVFLFGCSECATLCHSGGKKEIIYLEKKFLATHINVTGWAILEPACSYTQNDKLLSKHQEEIEKADIILVFACGDGNQVISEIFPEKCILSGTNTLFLGAKTSSRSFQRRCNLCGTCIVDEFNGMCPITRCPKQMLNGPCGGSENGKCEVYPDMPCIWEEIERKARLVGNYEQIFLQIHPAHDWSQSLLLFKER